jgi:hypothetical protein
MSKLDLIGQKFGRLTVLEKANSIKGDTAWKCKCDCGNIKITKTEYLRNGDCKSCGCITKERCVVMSKSLTRRKYSPLEATARFIWNKRYSEMDFEDFYNLSQQNCYYCGEPPSNITESSRTRSLKDEKESGIFIYNGLDRVDNNKVHTKENCVPCCKYCNYAKSDLTLKEFKEWVIAAYNGFIKSNKYCE